jgi:dCMP deaminase
MRQHWAKFFIDIAYMYANQVTCASGRKVGCVISRGNRQISAGFNGVKPKVPHPDKCERLIYGVPSGGGLHMCECDHAEANAIDFAKRMGIDIVGAEMYATAQPCDLCSAKIIEAKLGAVYYDVPYPGSNSLIDFFQAGIMCEPYHNVVLRSLSVGEQSNYLLELTKNERGLDRIAKLIPTFIHLSAGMAEAFACAIVNRSGVFGKEEPITEWNELDCTITVKLSETAMPIKIAPKENIILGLQAHYGVPNFLN